MLPFSYLLQPLKYIVDNEYNNNNNDHIALIQTLGTTVGTSDMRSLNMHIYYFDYVQDLNLTNCTKCLT